MATAIFRCEKCKYEQTMQFQPGNKLIPICPKCNNSMERSFQNIGIGTVVDDTLIYAADTMLHGKLPSGKHKTVF